VDFLNFVDDDGSNPFTTYAFVDPGGAPGSSADAQGSLASTVADTLSGAVNLSGTAVGLPGLPATLAFSTGWVSGGVLAINNGTAPALLSIQLDWDWVIALLADDSVLDSSLGQVVLDVFEDGLFLWSRSPCHSRSCSGRVRQVAVPAPTRTGMSPCISTSGLGRRHVSRRTSGWPRSSRTSGASTWSA